MGQFHVFPMVGYINHGLEGQVFGFFKYILQHGICIMKGTAIPEGFFLFVSIGPMLFFHISLGNPMVVPEMAAHRMQNDKISLSNGNLG